MNNESGNTHVAMLYISLVSYFKRIFYIGPFLLIEDVWRECIFITAGARSTL